MNTFSSPVRHLLLTILALAPSVASQTTGVPGLNDYTVNGHTSGSTSCQSVDLVIGSVAEFRVDTGVPGTMVAFMFSFCPCEPCWFRMPPVGCGGLIPWTACVVNPSNQSIDINLSAGCGPVAVFLPTDGAGVATFALPIPPSALGILFSTQAAIVGNPCSGPFPLLTQAYDLNVIS